MLERYAGRNSIHLHSEYLGASVLLLVGAAYAARGALRRQVWFWTGALVVTTLWALGGYTPFYRLVYAFVPGTAYFRAPSTMLYVVSFCTAVLAGVGVDRVLSSAERAGRWPTYAAAWVAAALVIALLATTGALTNLSAAFALPGREALVDANAPALAAGAWRSFLAVALAAGVLSRSARAGRSPSFGAGACLAMRTPPVRAGPCAPGIVRQPRRWSAIRPARPRTPHTANSPTVSGGFWNVAHETPVRGTFAAGPGRETRCRDQRPPPAHADG